MIERAMLVAATGGAVVSAGRVERFAAFATDSREAAAGDLFVAVRGVHADGHDFAADAVARGAAGVLISADRLAEAPDRWRALGERGAFVLAVADVRRALRDYAAYVLRAWRPRVIAVAGSAGKTTTKEAIATILATQASTFRSWQNYNDLLGVPLSLGRLEPHHEFAVIELGCDAPGEMAALTDLIQPEIGVLLNALAGNLDAFGDVAGVAAALADLPRTMPPGGTIVLNAGDDHLRALGEQLRAGGNDPRVVWCNSPRHDAQHRPLVKGLHQPERDHLRLHLHWRGGGGDFVFPHLIGTGAIWYPDVLAALTVAVLAGIDRVAAATALVNFVPPPGRMQPLPGADGLQLIDDSHNALPEVMALALRELAQVHPHRQRVAVLGDMTHLGAAEHAWHASVGREAAQQFGASTISGERAEKLVNTFWLVTRGERAEIIARAAREAGMPEARIIVTHTAADAAQAVRGIARQAMPPPVVLIKGSPEMRMEEVTARLLAAPETAPDVLDRQRAVWRRPVVAQPVRPTWIEVDLGAIGDNTRRIKQLVGPDVRVMATIKADAYGHGALKVARTALRNGAEQLGVASLNEAEPLRAAGIIAPILVYGYTPPWLARRAAELDLRLTVYDLETARALAAQRERHATPAAVHVKIDTGMARLGLRAEAPDDIVAFLRDLAGLRGIAVEGLYTHFATADEADQSYVREQLRRFRAVLAAVEAAGLRPPLVHAANSAATLAMPEARFDMVRPGIALYGLQPSDDVRLPAGFRPALSFKTQIALVRTVPAGEGVSYGRTYVTSAPERLATLPVGYADGFRRGPANWGCVLIHGQRAPIRGRVCMDQTIVSVDHIPAARAGDEVVLIGQQGADAITADEVAARLGTSNYEVVAAILARVPRVNA